MTEYQDIKKKLTVAFRNLRKAGYFARQNFWCCQSCACAAIPTQHEEKYIFYHRQDNDYLKEKGECYLAWGGDGEEIVQILRDAGVYVEWDGNSNTRILVMGFWAHIKRENAKGKTFSTINFGD